MASQASGSATPVDAAAGGPEYAGSGSPGGKDNRRNKRFSLWRPKWIQKQGTTAGQENSQAVAPQGTSSVWVDLPANQHDDAQNTTNKKVLRMQEPESELHPPESPDARSVREFGLSRPFVPGGSKTDGPTHSFVDTSITKQAARKKNHGFSVFLWDEDQKSDKVQRLKESTGSTNPSTTDKEAKGGPSWYRKMSAFAYKVVGKRFSIASSKPVDNASDAVDNDRCRTPLRSAREQVELQKKRFADNSSKVPTGHALCHYSDNYGREGNGFCLLPPLVTEDASTSFLLPPATHGLTTCALPPPVTGSAMTILLPLAATESVMTCPWPPPATDGATTSTADVNASSSSKRAYPSFIQSRAFTTEPEAFASLAPVVDSSGPDADKMGTVATSNATGFGSHPSDEIHMAEPGADAKSRSSSVIGYRKSELSSQSHMPATVSGTATPVTPSLEGLAVKNRAIPPDSRPMNADTRELDSKTALTEAERVSGNNLRRHPVGVTSDLVTDKERTNGVCKDGEGQVSKNISQLIVKGETGTHAKRPGEISTNKIEGNDTIRRKKARLKMRSGKKKGVGGKKAKRSGNKSEYSAVLKSSSCEPTRLDGGTPASDQQPEVSRFKSDEPSEIAKASLGENMGKTLIPKAASDFDIKGNDYQETLGFNAVTSVRAGQQRSTTSHQAVPSSAWPLHSTESDAAGTRRMSAEYGDLTKPSVQPEAACEQKVDTTALERKSKLRQASDNGTSDQKAPFKESWTSKSPTKRSSQSPVRKKVVKDHAGGLDGNDHVMTEVGTSKDVCPGSTVIQKKDGGPPFNTTHTPGNVETTGVSHDHAKQAKPLAASMSAYQTSSLKDCAATKVEQTHISTASDVGLASTTRLICRQIQARFKLHEKRKQSVVSFGRGVKEPHADDKKPPLKRESTALAHLQELTLKSTSKKKSLSTILKSPTAPKGFTQRAPSVDFGPEKFTLISPLHTTAVSRLPSRISIGSMSSFGESSGSNRGRRPTAANLVSRPQNSLFDDTSTLRTGGGSTRQFMTGNPIGSKFGTATKKNTRSGRERDVHNALILGPSLMTVLGNICSFRSGGNKKALRGVSLASHVALRSVSEVTWAVATLPGVLLALVACSAVIWLIYVKPYEPAPYSSENLGVMRVAREKYASRQQRHRLALLSAQTSMMLATSLVTSCMQSAFDFIREVWHVVPWSVLLFIGATQVSSKLLQVYDIPHGVFKLVSPSFWEERTAVEARVMLAIAASSVMAADKQAIVQVMAPVVANITGILQLACYPQAEVQRMHPTYYAIPVIVGASSNVIMPASAPLAILHELARVSFWKLLLLGLLAKAIVVSMAIVMVNVADMSGLLGDQRAPE